MAKDCLAALPTKSVEEDEEVVWGSLMVDELDDIDAAEKKAAERGNQKTTPDPRELTNPGIKD